MLPQALKEESSFWLPHPLPDKEQKIFSMRGAQFHKVSNVWRVESGEKIVLFDGEGSTVGCVVKECAKRELILEAETPVTFHPKKNQPLILYQGILKSQAFDLLVSKSAEIGVDCIVPFVTLRTVAKKQEITPSRLTRLHEIAAHACSSAHNPWIPQIVSPMAFRKLTDVPNHFLKLFCHSASLPKANIGESDYANAIALVVGPEGGFSQEEAELALALGFTPFHFSEKILRAETAAFVALGIIQYQRFSLSLPNQ